MLGPATGGGDGMEVGHDDDDGGCHHVKLKNPRYRYTRIYLYRYAFVPSPARIAGGMQLPQASARHRPIATLVQDTGISGQLRTKRYST